MRTTLRSVTAAHAKPRGAEPDPARARPDGRPLALPAFALALAAALALAWNDVLPGGWRLHGLIEPHALAARRDQARRAAARVMRFRIENETAPAGAVVFLGSSTIERFPLDACFPGAACLDRGIGNERAAELERRLDASLPTVPLGGAVLFSGRVEHLAGELAPAEIRIHVARVVERLRALRPELPIALIGVLPARAQSADEIARLDALDAELRALALERGLAFVDTARAPMRDATGSLPEALSADRLHLGDEGYRVLARWLREDGGAACERLR